MTTRLSARVGAEELIIEHGRMAKQADGSVLVQYGGTVVLVAVVASVEPRESQDFLPLQIEYREKTYAAGKIPGNFFRREGRPSETETLTSRLIDRPLRPLFPEGYFNEVQIMATVLSHDQQNNPDVMAMVGASAALLISQIPFDTAVGAVRVGRVDGQFVVNPTYSQLEQSDMDLVVCGTESAVMMVEGGAKEIPEADLMDAIDFGHRALVTTIGLQRDLQRQCGVTKDAPPVVVREEELVAHVGERIGDRFNEIFSIKEKQKRQETSDQLVKTIQDDLKLAYPDREGEIAAAYEELARAHLRKMILERGVRADGRGSKEIRSISAEVGLLPRVHGSALFTRGETQALAATTLGTARDEQRMDDLRGETFKSFILHYNFPPYSVGEVKPIRGPGRREIGHGALAERALKPVITQDTSFPYTIRIVSDVLESNGSSSMATVCGASLSLMDAGVPITSPVAGIAMGLVKDDGKAEVLSDIMGLEDHLGDMDFKVAGTAKGITAFQMDIKVEGVDRAILSAALEQAREGRLFILDEMSKTLAHSRPDLSPLAPSITQIVIDTDKIGAVIGPGGKVIRDIQAKSGATIDIEDDGTVSVSAVDKKSTDIALGMIQRLTEEVAVGKNYTGTVKKITDFGAFVEVLPGKEGLVHISELADHRVAKVEDVVHEGDAVTVQCIDVDPQGRIKLSKRAAEGNPKPPGERSERSERSDRGGRRDRGDREFGRRESRGRRP